MKQLFILICLIFVSCSTPDKYYSVEDFSRIEKIDAHVHIRTDRDAFIEQAQKDNFKLITINTDAYGGFETIQEQFDYAVLQTQKHPDVITFIATFSMSGWDEPEWSHQSMQWLQSCIDAGAIAVKVWKNIGMVYRDKSGELVMIDDPGFDPIFSTLSKNHIPVTGHLGEPKNCWLPIEKMTTTNDKSYFSDHPQYHMYKLPDMPSYEEQIAARDRMLEKNPDLIFIGCHLGSLEWDVDELAQRLDKFPNMAVDMAARMGQLFYQTRENRDKVRNFFIKYQDRLLYGTDMADSGKKDQTKMKTTMHKIWLKDWTYFTMDNTMTSELIEGEFQGLKLPQNVINKIYRENAKCWYNIFR